MKRTRVARKRRHTRRISRAKNFQRFVKVDSHEGDKGKKETGRVL